MVNPVKFAQDAYIELRKVTWIPRRQMIVSTVVVLILTALVSLFIAVVDILVVQFFSAFIKM